MLSVYRYVPGWGMPCISPFVTKVVYYLQMARIPHQIVGQDSSRLSQDAPYGKLPYIVDDGKKIADSTTIIDYLESKFGGRLDGDALPIEKAQMCAWNRMIDEHTYWCAVIQPRWRERANFEIYVPILFGTDPVPAAARQFLEGVREAAVSQLVGHGMGRLPDAVVYQRARADIDALAGFLASKPFFMGDTLRSIDANVLSILKHIINSPFAFDTKDYARGKKNLVDYCARLDEYLEAQKIL
jgi:isoprene-epoxide---glutathione S-transferase